MKKIFTLLCVTLSSLAAMANGVEVNGVYYVLDSEKMTASVTYMGTSFSSGNNYAGDIVIPDTIVYDENKYTVTSIEKRAFYNCSGLTSVTIGNSITTIGQDAFYECSSLTSIDVDVANTRYTSIDDVLFNYTKDTLIQYPIGNTRPTYTIPQSVTTIGDDAFADCDSLISITIGNSVTTIGRMAFNDCSGLIFVTIPNSVTTIGNNAFQYCTSLTKTNYTGSIADWCKIKFGNSGSNPISYSHNLYINDAEVKDLVIPNSVTKINNYAFDGCSGLTSVTIPNSMKSIGISAFSDCSSLTSVTIPNSIKRLENSVFENCSSLTSITIPNSITSIKNHTFDGCSSLASISVEDGNSIYDSRENCNAIIETATNTLIVGCQNTIIPNSVTTIGGYAFYGQSGLTSITIPNSVTTIGSHAFYECNNLKSITSLAHIPPYLEDKAFGTSLVLYVPDTIAEAYFKSEQWNSFIITPCSYIVNKVKIPSNPIGKLQVNIDSNDSSLLIIFAPDVNDLIFSQWSDGDTTNPRLVRDTQDVVILAKYTSKFPDVVVESYKTTGNSFWVALPKITSADNEIRSFEAFIAIASHEEGVITIINPNTGWSHTPINVQASSWTEIRDIPAEQWYDLNWTVENCGEKVDNKGLLVEATAEVSVYVGMGIRYSYDISNVLPITAIQSEYILQDYPPYSSTIGAHASFAIVANEDSTEIYITLSTPSIGGRPANSIFTITLNKGQTYQVLSKYQQSFTGTHVAARDGKKISVFSGADLTQIPAGAASRECLFEQAIPIDYWGNEFVVTQSLDKDANRIRVTAKEANTLVNVDGNCVAILNIGQTYEFEVSNNLATTDMASKILNAGGEFPDVYPGEAHYIQTSHPVAVYNYDVGNAYSFKTTIEKIGDPSMVWISPLQHRVNNVIFGTCAIQQTHRHYVNIVCLTADTNNVALLSAYKQPVPLTFMPVSSNPTYSYARTPLIDTYAAPREVGIYTITSKYGVIAHVYGNGEDESYSYSVGGPQWVPLVVDVDPITPDTTQLSWFPVDSASLYKLRIYSEQIELDTTLMIEADSLNGGISIPVSLAPNRDRRMPMDDIGSVVVITLEPNSGATKDTPFKVTVSTKSKDKIDICFDLQVLKGEKTIKQESGSFALNAPVLDGLEDIPVYRFGVSSGIFDLYGHRYTHSQWNTLPAGIYILRDGEKASKVMKK